MADHIEAIVMPLNETLDLDEKRCKPESRCLINIRAVRKLAKDQKWYDEHRNKFVLLKDGVVIAKYDYAHLAMEHEDIDANIYTILIPYQFNSASG